MVATRSLLARIERLEAQFPRPNHVAYLAFASQEAFEAALVEAERSGRPLGGPDCRVLRVYIGINIGELL